MNVVKQIEDQDKYPGTHIVLTSEEVGVIEICRQQHKEPFHKQNMLKDHFLLFAVEGINELRIRDQFFSLTKGDMLLIKKASYVEIVKKGDPQNDFLYESVSFTLKKDIIVDFIKLIEMDAHAGRPATEDEAIVHAYGARLQTFLASLKPYFDDNENIKTGLFKLKILELLYDLAQLNPQFLQELIDLNRFETRDLMKTMQEHYFQSYTIQELASISGRSLSSFRREFKSLFHATPAKWIQDKRLLKAKELLFSTQLTIADICYEIGYENVSHFSRLFKSHFGYNPSEVRKSK